MSKKLPLIIGALLAAVTLAWWVWSYGEMRAANALASARRDSIQRAGEILAESTVAWTEERARLSQQVEQLSRQAQVLRSRWTASSRVADSLNHELGERVLPGLDDSTRVAVLAVIAAKDTALQQCSVLVANCEERVAALQNQVDVEIRRAAAWEDRADGLKAAWVDAEKRAKRRWYEKPTTTIGALLLVVLSSQLLR